MSFLFVYLMGAGIASLINYLSVFAENQVFFSAKNLVRAKKYVVLIYRMHLIM